MGPVYKNHVFPEVSAVMNPVLILDIAPARTSQISKELYDATQGILGIKTMFQPPSSPDQSPLD